MSGIGGVVYPGDGGLEHNLAATMSAVLCHRGETEELVFPDTDTAFFCRHKHSGVYQPGVTRSESIYVVADGRVRTPDQTVLWGQALSDYICATYQAQGVQCLADLDGGVAVCIYDRNTRNVVLSRDMFARRPLYYAYQENRFWFASEIKAILSDPNFKRRVNTSSLAQQLTYRGNWGPHTLFQDVFKVVPGFVVAGNLGAGHGAAPFTMRFNLRPAPVKKSRAGAAHYGKLLWRYLCQNITDQTITDRGSTAGPRPGLLMSGGIDSALIAAAQRECSLDNTTAISCGYSDPKARPYDETAVARENAHRYGLSSQTVTLNAQDDLLGLLRRTVFNTEEPPRTFISLATERALEHLQGDLDVLMTGTGADVLFGEQTQYDTPIYWLRKRCPPILWKALRRTVPLLQRIPRLRGYAAWFKRGDVASMKEYLLLNQRVNGNLRGLIDSPDPASCAEHIGQIYQHLNGLGPDDEYTLVGTLMFAHCFNEMFENIGSHNGVDMIHPFQSNSLHQLSVQMPYRHKVSRKYTKPCLRELAAKHYSEEFAYREKTRFSSPGTVWLSQSLQLQAAAHRLAQPGAHIGHYLDVNAVRNIVDEYQKEVANAQLTQRTAQLIYTLIGFEIWLETFFTNQSEASDESVADPVPMNP